MNTLLTRTLTHTTTDSHEYATHTNTHSHDNFSSLFRALRELDNRTSLRKSLALAIDDNPIAHTPSLLVPGNSESVESSGRDDSHAGIGAMASIQYIQSNNVYISALKL